MRSYNHFEMGADNTIETSDIRTPAHQLCKQNTRDCAIFDEYARVCEELDRLQEQVRLDHLTGLFNVRHLVQVLEQEIERTMRTLLPTTFILLDVDHFKSFNDTYGHVVGDKVLVHLATILRDNVRKIDIACRYGGEEFAIILPSTPLLIGIQVAERIRHTIEQSPLSVDGEPLSITASLGVDSYFAHSTDGAKGFIARTDQYLYEAKQQGRNQVQHAVYPKTDKARVTDDERDELFRSLDDEGKSE